jgi:hypothetical protein
MELETQIWLMKLFAELKERKRKQDEKARKMEQRKHKDNKIG